MGDTGLAIQASTGRLPARVVPLAGGRSNLHRTVERREPVGDLLQPGAVGGRGRVEAHAVVGHLEAKTPVAV